MKGKKLLNNERLMRAYKDVLSSEGMQDEVFERGVAAVLNEIAFGDERR